MDEEVRLIVSELFLWDLVVLVLCLDDCLAEKFIGLEKYGLIITPGDGRPRKSG
jgi:hypothetical protein